VATIVGLVQLKHSDKDAADADHKPLTSGQPSSAAPPTLSGSLYGTGVPSTAEPSPSMGKLGGQVPDKFRVVDLTFVDHHAWALGRGSCLDGAPGLCDAVLRSDDDGADWSSTPNPPVPVTATCDDPAADPCVSHLRFASSKIGYAFGANSLYMTTDGGTSWSPKNQGPTSSLEVAHETALRVSGSQLLKAKVGSPDWKPAVLPTPKATVRAPVVRALSHAYVPAARGDTIYASSDDGASWSTQTAPCAGSIASMSAGVDGSLAVLCASPTDNSAPALFVSENGASSFTPWAGVTNQPERNVFAAANASTLFRSAPGRLDRSTDGGKTWQTVATGNADGLISFLGFENQTTGRWVTGDGSTIYTTADGGVYWTPYTFK
jgi:photosystem II stability/assembly factor-like uncharacterized protein